MLMELMIVVALILVLFTMYWGGGFGGKAKKQRNFGPCSKNLQFIHTALLTYATDNNDKFPLLPKAATAEEALAPLIPKYISQTGPFICPSSGHPKLSEGESIAKKKISYGYLMGLSRASEPGQWLMSDEQIDSRPKHQGDPVFANSEKGPGSNHGAFGGNLLMVDGSVKTIEAKTPFSLARTNTTYLNPRILKD